MPQSIEDVIEWQEMLGDNWKADHETWLHRLGNLTLTAYNGPLSNSPFDKKKPIFDVGAVRITKYVKDQERWGIEEMRERGRILAERALEIWPHHDADEKLVLEERRRELKTRAGQRSASSLVMSENVRRLLTATQSAIYELGPSIEVIENRSVCYYDDSASFFAELLPRAYYVRLLIPLDFDEVEYPDGLANNVTAWKFLTHVTHRDCGVFIDIWEEQHIAVAMPMVRQAFNMAAD